jgi:hypothetical protein
MVKSLQSFTGEIKNVFHFVIIKVLIRIKYGTLSIIHGFKHSIICNMVSENIKGLRVIRVGETKKISEAPL